VIDSILVFEKRDDCPLDYYYLVGVMNSKINNFIYKNLTQESDRAFAQVKPINVRKLVIPNLDDYKMSQISSIVKNIIENINSGNNYDYKNDESKIDDILFEYYELTPNEIRIIENV
jgi:hypothetical protein